MAAIHSRISEEKPETTAAPRGRLAMLLMAIAIWGGLVLQLVLSIQITISNGKPAALGIVIYLGYFTILTNLLAALVLTFTLARRNGAARRLFTHPQVTGCAATSILLVGLGYHFLLREIWDPQGLQWLADFTLHYVTPIGFCALWLFQAPQTTPWWSPLRWCLYPLAYFCYAMLRGLFKLPYPYPFIDVTVIGYPQTLLNFLGLSAAFAIAGFLMLAAHKAAGKAMGR